MCMYRVAQIKWSNCSRLSLSLKCLNQFGTKAYLNIPTVMQIGSGVLQTWAIKLQKTLFSSASVHLLVHGQVTIIFVVSVCLFVQSFSRPSSIRFGSN